MAASGVGWSCQSEAVGGLVYVTTGSSWQGCSQAAWGFFWSNQVGRQAGRQVGLQRPWTAECYGCVVRCQVLSAGSCVVYSSYCRDTGWQLLHWFVLSLLLGPRAAAITATCSCAPCWDAVPPPPTFVSTGLTRSKGSWVLPSSDMTMLVSFFVYADLY